MIDTDTDEIKKEVVLEESTILPGHPFENNFLEKAGFFQEDVNSFSMMRLISFLCIVAGIIESFIGCIAVFKGIDGAFTILGFSGSLITAGFTGKFLQKIKE